MIFELKKEYKLSEGETLILMALTQMQKNPTNADIERFTGISLSTIKRGLLKLSFKGLIAIVLNKNKREIKIKDFSSYQKNKGGQNEPVQTDLVAQIEPVQIELPAQIEPPLAPAGKEKRKNEWKKPDNYIYNNNIYNNFIYKNINIVSIFEFFEKMRAEFFDTSQRKATSIKLASLYQSVRASYKVCQTFNISLNEALLKKIIERKMKVLNRLFESKKQVPKDKRHYIDLKTFINSNRIIRNIDDLAKDIYADSWYLWFSSLKGNERVLTVDYSRLNNSIPKKNRIDNIFVNDICINEIFAFLEENRRSIRAKNGGVFSDNPLTSVEAFKVQKMLKETLEFLKEEGKTLSREDIFKIIGKKASLLEAWPPIYDQMFKYFNLSTLLKKENILKNLESAYSLDSKKDAWYWLVRYPKIENRSGDLRGMHAYQKRVEEVRARSAMYMSEEV
jgi:DNA-binding IscR family transcriptional regulator